MSQDQLAKFSKYNTYWYCRDLIKSAFDGFASSETETCKEISSDLLDRLDDESYTVEDHLEFVEEKVLGSMRGGTNRFRKTRELVERLRRRTNDKEDVKALAIAFHATARTTEVLNNTENFGKEEIINIVDETIENSQQLDKSKGYDALYNVDLAGEQYQLASQREGIVPYISELRDRIDEEKFDRVVSAVVQEYERRAGQSRVSTAGNVLETALQHIFDRFDIPATGKPEHFGDLEIDNIVRGEEGSIGFSCKRTLRERFRQSLSRQAEIGVDETWFVSLMLADVSKDKLKDIGNDGGRIYVPRDSFVWREFGDKDEMDGVLYPADSFIEDIAEFTGNSLNTVNEEES